MKVGTTRTMKYGLLKTRLGWPEWQVIGLLNTIWNIATTSAVHGDIGRFSDADLASALGMDQPIFDKALAAMIETRWIDRDPKRRLVIHDWMDHCEQWVKEAAKRKEWVPSDTQTEPMRTQTYADVRKVIPPILSSPSLSLPSPPIPIHTSPVPPVATGGDGKSFVEIPEVLDTPDFRAAWAEWLAYRRERKLSKPTGMTIKATFRRFEADLGPERAAAAIRHSIEKGWQSINEPKEYGIGPKGDPKRNGAVAERAAKEAREYPRSTAPIPIFRPGSSQVPTDGPRSAQETRHV